MGRHLPRRPAAPRRHAAWRLHRPAAERGRVPQGGQLGRVRALDQRAPVHPARCHVRAPRSRHDSLVEGRGSRLRPAHRLQPDGQLRAAAHHLDGRARASQRSRASHMGGILHRPVEPQHARRHHHAHQDGLAPAQRRAHERPGDHDGALHPPRQPPDGDELREGSRVPVRAHGAHHQLRGESRGQRERVGRLRARAGGGRDPRQPTRPRAALPAGADRTHRGVPAQRRRAGGGRARRSGHALSGIRRSRALDPGWRATGHAAATHHAVARAHAAAAFRGGARHARARQRVPAGRRRRPHRGASGRRRRAAGGHRAGSAHRQSACGGAAAVRQADSRHRQHPRASGPCRRQ